MSDGQNAFIIISKVTGFLSMCGTSYMIQEIGRDPKRLKRTYFRLMLGMACVEFCDGLAFFLGSWMVPPPGFLAAGNATTCNFQGFLLQANVASTLYNASLAIYYLLSIKFDWSERLIGQKIEPWMHAISLSIGYGTAIAGTALGLFMSFGDVCYIGKYPYGCKETYQHGYTTCTHGDNSSLYVLFFYTIWSWSSIGITAISMLIIWCHVRSHENNMARYSYSAPSRQNSKRFAIQGALYVLVFYCSHFFATVALYYVRSSRYNPVVMTFIRVMYGLLFPLEGFLNFLVYMRPRIIKYLKKKRDNFTQSLFTTSAIDPSTKDTEAQNAGTTVEVIVDCAASDSGNQEEHPSSTSNKQQSAGKKKKQEEKGNSPKKEAARPKNNKEDDNDDNASQQSGLQSFHLDHTSSHNNDNDVSHSNGGEESATDRQSHRWRNSFFTRLQHRQPGQPGGGRPGGQTQASILRELLQDEREQVEMCEY